MESMATTNNGEAQMGSVQTYRVEIHTTSGQSESFELPGGNCFSRDDVERIAAERTAWAERELNTSAWWRVLAL
jgi:hypothetical protein